MTVHVSALRRSAGWLCFILAGPLLLVIADRVPFLVRANLVFLALYALAAVGLTLIVGFAGQVSLGHAAFFGVGAYAVAILTTRAGWPLWAACVVGLVVAAALAAFLGSLVFRLRGHFLAMATLAFGLIFYYLIRSLDTVTGGNGGLGGIPVLSLGPWSAGGDVPMFLLAWLTLAAGLLIAGNIVDAGAGRALRAIGSSEAAAACCGVDVARAKSSVFVVGALYAAIAGCLYAVYVTFVSPESFGVLTSVEFLVISAVGGLTTVWGAPLGAAFTVIATELTRATVPHLVEGATGSHEIIVYGLALIVVLLTCEDGLAGFLARGTRWRWRFHRGWLANTTPGVDNNQQVLNR